MTPRSTIVAALLCTSARAFGVPLDMLCDDAQAVMACTGSAEVAAAPIEARAGEPLVTPAAVNPSASA